MGTTNSTGRHEILVGLRVTDEVACQRYRDCMTPLLHEMGGEFRLDARTSEVLRGEAGINRVFVVSFPDAGVKEAYFSRPEYLACRDRHFDAAVEKTVIIASYDL